MNNNHIAHNDHPTVGQDDVTIAREFGAQFTPADFFQDAGTIIAACLGLGLLMRILLG